MQIALEILVPVLTFVIGLLAGMFFKYSDITGMKRDIKHLQENVNVMNVVDIASSIKLMRESVIFTPQFQQEISTICSEHERMRSQIEINTTELAVLKSKSEK